MSKRILKFTSLLLSILILSLFFFSTTNADIYSSISGRVIAEDTGEGVADVSVLASMVEERRGHYFATTDERGVYVIKDLKPGTYMIGFRGPDRYLFGPPHIKVILPKGKNVVNVNHIFTLGGSVSGTVYDADGVTPMSEVRVSADVPNPQPEWVVGSRGGLTDSNGNFLIQGLLESDNCIVQVNVRGHANLTKTVKITKGEVTENVNFVVKWDDITGITGYVKSSIDNQPLKNARIMLRDNIGNDIGFAWTDETGKYLIIGVVPGVYKVRASVVWPPGKITSETKEGIIVNSGEQTIVNFYFSNPSNNSSWIEQLFANWFISEAFAATGAGSGYPKPTIQLCGEQTGAVEDAYDIMTYKLDNPEDCMSEDIRNKLKKKIKAGDKHILSKLH